MDKAIPFHLMMAAISIFVLFSFFLPNIMKWDIAEYAIADPPPVSVAIQSDEFRLSLVVSLSVSAPVLFELVLRTLFYVKLDAVVPNFLTFTSLAVPDLIILCYIRDSMDLISLNFLLKARFILLSWLAFTYIKKYGGNRWPSKSLLTLFIFLCGGRVIGFYKGYVTNHVYDILNILGIIFDLVAFLILLFMSVKWYNFIFRKTKLTTISNNYYMCNIYVTAYLLTCFGLFMNLYASPNSLDFYHWNTNELTIHTLMYTIFYIIVIVFEGRFLHKEILQTKVYFMT